jgi:hypothetical protein
MTENLSRLCHRIIYMLGNTHLDLTFARIVSAEFMPTISYLSYRRSVLNRLYNKHCLQYNTSFHSFNTYHARRGPNTYWGQNLRPCRRHSPPLSFHNLNTFPRNNISVGSKSGKVAERGVPHRMLWSFSVYYRPESERLPSVNFAHEYSCMFCFMAAH